MLSAALMSVYDWLHEGPHRVWVIRAIVSIYAIRLVGIRVGKPQHDYKERALVSGFEFVEYP
jgi:hypothetical protein